MFQSTPPYGGRPALTRSFGSSWRFNPRPRMGGDVQGNFLTNPCVRFQSTPPYGGRLKWIAVSRDLLVSIHAPVWGATVVHVINTL